MTYKISVSIDTAEIFKSIEADIRKNFEENFIGQYQYDAIPLPMRETYESARDYAIEHARKKGYSLRVAADSAHGPYDSRVMGYEKAPHRLILMCPLPNTVENLAICLHEFGHVANGDVFGLHNEVMALRNSSDHSVLQQEVEASRWALRRLRVAGAPWRDAVTYLAKFLASYGTTQKEAEMCLFNLDGTTVPRPKAHSKTKVPVKATLKYKVEDTYKREDAYMSFRESYEHLVRDNFYRNHYTKVTGVWLSNPEVEFRCSTCGQVATGDPGIEGSKHMRQVPPQPQHRIRPDGTVETTINTVYTLHQCGIWRKHG